MSDQWERLYAARPGLCPALHWKSQFIWSEPDPTVPASNSQLYWCGMTQTCIGPDGKLADPENCCAEGRSCHCGNEE